jgi:photosystem I subunit XI
MQTVPRSTMIYSEDFQTASVLTPINNSPFIRFFIANLPINRANLDPFFRGLEVGMAHGYWMLGPFTLLGPLRNLSTVARDAAPFALGAALAATIGLIVVCTLAISLYATAKPDDDTNFGAEGWSRFAGGWLIGGVGGAIFAAFLLILSPVLSTLILGAFPG